MVYVDSDGVLSDFRGWVRSINPKAFDSKEAKKEIYKIMADNCDRCFLDSKVIKNGMLMYLVATNPEYYVLTSLSSYKGFKENTDLSDEEIIKVLRKLKENKFKWFEQQGVPRHKVIIVDSRLDKLSYCCTGDILYDDYEETINRWHNLGGIGVLVESR